MRGIFLLTKGKFVVRVALLPSPVVLKQATINGAKQLGMEGLLGELIPGAYADLFVLGREPLEDVASLDRIDENLIAIMKDGRFVKSKIQDVRVERSCAWNE
jgi:imidazolonepropionase-like amidohydrolase